MLNLRPIWIFPCINFVFVCFQWPIENLRQVAHKWVYRRFSCVYQIISLYFESPHFPTHRHKHTERNTTNNRKMITYALKYHILTYLKFHKVAAYQKIVFHLFLMWHIVCCCVCVMKKTLELNLKATQGEREKMNERQRFSDKIHRYINQIKSIT